MLLLDENIERDDKVDTLETSQRRRFNRYLATLKMFAWDCEKKQLNVMVLFIVSEEYTITKPVIFFCFVKGKGFRVVDNQVEVD